MVNNRGYYYEYDDYSNETIIDNPIGVGLDIDRPLTRLDTENYITGREKIFQCMRDILDTPRGTRFMFPTYGSDLYKALSEPNDMILEDEAELYIREALTQWEPRVVIQSVVCEVSKEDSNILLAKIEYKMKNSNDVDSFVYSTNRQIPEMR